jgi:hypothetical protein
MEDHINFFINRRKPQIGNKKALTLATATAPASASAKEASNSTDFCVCFVAFPTIELPLSGNLES